MTSYLLRFGQTTSVILITLVSVLASILITLLVLLSAGLTDSIKIGLLISVIAPGLIAPTISWYIIGLLLKIHELEQQQHQFASFDELTSVMTRRAFLENAETLLRQSKRRHEPFILAVFDIDGMKTINDQYGIRSGNNVLDSFAATLIGNTRESDLIGRIAGQEFALILTNTEIDMAYEIVEEIRQTTATDVVCTDLGKIKYTVSIGMTSYAFEQDPDLVELFKQASKALHQAKTQGRNKVIKDDTD